MANPYTEYFTDIANAIREKFKISGGLKISQFANKIDSSFPIIEYTNFDSMQDYIDRVLSAVADAIRSQRGNSTSLYGREIPDAIRNLRTVSYGSYTTASQSNVTWTSKPSMPSVSLSQTSYTLSWEYYWSHSSYDKYKIYTVSITPNNNSIYNPAHGSNIRTRPYGGDVEDSLVIRCSYSKTVDLSGLISNMQSWGAPESEILAEMQSELSSEISSVNNGAGTFSFNIGYYGGTYI